MKAILALLIFLFSFGALQQTFSQDVQVNRSNNKVSLGGKPYYIHIVRKGETLFAISQAYQVPIDSLKKDNLHLTSDIKINQYIKIRIQEVKKAAEQTFNYHKVVKGDTPFNISRKYQLSIDEIYQHNPDAKLGIRIGELLKIPVNQAITVVNDTLDNELTTSTQAISTDTSFLMHVVKRKQTKFGISASYKISIEELEAANPGLRDRMLQTGELLKIPQTKSDLLENEDFVYHKVSKQETLFGLAKKYDLKERHLIKANPFLKERGLQEGDLLKIERNPMADSLSMASFTPDTIVQEITPKPQEPVIQKDSLIRQICPIPEPDTVTKYKVALFLPLYLNINDTLGKFVDIITKDVDGNEILESVLRTGRIEDKIYPRSKIFLEFYQGALLALKDLKELGISLEVHVIDTRNDSLYMAELLKTRDFSDFNLFIGPVFGELLSLVGDYAWEHQINIVSPLSIKSGFIDHNPYAFQVSPPFNVQMQHASEFLNNFDVKNYIVIHDGNNLDQEYISYFKEQLFSQMNESNFDQIKYNEVFYYDAQDSVLKSVFTPGMENIVIVPSNSQAFVTDVMGKLNGYSYEFNITTFGQPRWVRFENIELDNFHNTHTHIFSNSYIDYGNLNVIDFVAEYRNQYSAEPDKYAFQGYDITKYFCQALNIYGHDFRKCIHQYRPELLQTRLYFVPYSEQGGYQNTAIYILAYTKDYRLIKAASYPSGF